MTRKGDHKSSYETFKSEQSEIRRLASLMTVNREEGKHRSDNLKNVHAVSESTHLLLESTPAMWELIHEL